MNVKDNVCSFPKLYLGYKKSKESVLWKDSVSCWYIHSLAKTRKLKLSHYNGTYKISPYPIFIIREPKERKITSTRFKDRVFQRSLCDNYLTKELTKHFISNNFACQKGKGTLKAQQCLDTMLRQFYKENGTNGYVLKLDIHDYFGSTDHQVAVKAIADRIDDEWVLGHVTNIINSFDKGIGLGSQVSQLIQLAVLDDIDKYIVNELHIKFYERYMDDLILIDSSKEFLKKCKGKIISLLKQKKLEVSPRKTFIAKVTQNIHFLGFSFLLHNNGSVTWKLLPKTLSRLRKKFLNELNVISPCEVEENYKNTKKSFIRHTDSRNQIRKLDKLMEEKIMNAELIKLKNELGKERAETECLKDKQERNLKINEEVCKVYSLSTQIAIIRKGLAHMGCDLDEFVAFNEFVEETKKAIDSEDKNAHNAQNGK